MRLIRCTLSMALKKWLPCAGQKWNGKPCREVAKFLGVEEDEEGKGKGKPLLVPVCDEHTRGYDRLREVTDEDLEKYGRM